MRQSFFGGFALLSLTVSAHEIKAEVHELPAFKVLSQNVNDQRRLVGVRIGQRLAEPDLIAIAERVRAADSHDFARTQISYFLPGMTAQQGDWATVTLTADVRVTVHGLRREDEDVLLAEYRADTRPLLGSWLTSPPAAPGRLTIYSDRGRIYAEWRLRNGQRTTDELHDTSVHTGRRFDVVGGGFYVLTRSGDLEIWDKATLIATADRIRPDQLAPPVTVALGVRQPASVVVHAGSVQKATPAALASPAQPEPATAALVPAATSTAAQSTAAGVADDGTPQEVAAKVKAQSSGKSKSKPRGPLTADATARTPRQQTPGEQISAKLGGL